MPNPAPALRHAIAGALEPTRIFVRYRASDAGPAAPESCTEATLASGDALLGPVRARVEVESDGGDCATWRTRVQNAGAEPVRVEAVGLGFRWRGPDAGALRFLRQGFQSWSFAGGAALDDAGTPPFPSGPWLRGFHHATPERPADRAGWHESDLVTAVGVSPRGPTCAVGVLESGVALGVVYLRRDGEAVRLEAEQRLEVPLEPGAVFELEPVRVALGDDAAPLLEAAAEAWGRHAGARTHAPFQAGWCSWYHFFHDVTEADFLRNLESLAAAREELPIRLVQLDDGYQREIGDWLESNEKFPGGLPAIARAVRDAGFTPGLWTAPFCVVPASRPFREHPDWLLRDEDGPLRGLIHPAWTPDGSVYVLDPTHPEVTAHLEDTFRTLTDWGFPYHKIDFLYTAALRARAHDAGVTRAARLRRGLDAIRAGVGESAFVLGCGCPLGPAVGAVDGMRIGPDTAPRWEAPEGIRIPGLEPTLPAGRNALRNTLARAWMHRRLWLNDPDCLLARSRESELTRDEARGLAASIAATGGMTVFSDDCAALAPADRALVRDTIEWARRVDESGQSGTVRTRSLLSDEIAPAAVAHARGDALVALWNPADRSGRVGLGADELGDEGAAAPEPLLGSPKPGERRDGRLELSLPEHGGALYRRRGRPPLAVFCDFDGTFAVQDVGATLARRHASDRRPALWERLTRGELTPWDYNLELLDGLALPESTLDEFLHSVELSDGAAELVDWCEAHGVPFRVLSDGFDRNLDRLQQLHGVRFAYDANHLHYENGAWRLAPGRRNPACGCGTGVCKRGRIEAFRAEHPGVPVVHIGNGRVSDLCGARAADRVYAKDTLAEELEAQGIPYRPFAALREVRDDLASWLERGGAGAG